MQRRPDTVRDYRDAFTQRDLVHELDALAVRAWPALTVLDLDGWRLRTARGFTTQANSVWPRAFGDRLDLATKLRNVERHYWSRGLPARFQVSPAAAPKGLDRVLAERGYVRSEAVEVRTAVLEDWPGIDRSPRAALELLAEPTERWLAAWARAAPRRADGDLADLADLAARILARVPAPSVYALAHVGGEDVAVARGVLDGGWLGLADVATVDGHRRKGIADALLVALGRWAADRGAQQAWLAVEASNTAAVALYRERGFQRAYTYRYRSRTGGDGR